MKHETAFAAASRQVRIFITWVISVSIACGLLSLPWRQAVAADHRDGPIFTGWPPTNDLNDAFFFLDPNDNSRVILAFSLAGSIAPPENVNAGVFDWSTKYRFQVENTGDAEGDVFIDVRFSEPAGPAAPQMATIAISGNRGSRTFTAPTTPGSLAEIPPNPFVTVDFPSGITFSAGLFDDPFFFDLPAESRYRSSVLAGQPDLTFLNRARDSFAGYNVLAVVLSVPATRLRGPAGDVIGLSGITLRPAMTMHFPERDPLHMGPFLSVDRMGVPSINSMLVPFARKDQYNRSSTTDDAAGRFANDIRASLRALGTDTAGIAELSGLAVVRGDMLRLDLLQPNNGGQGGDNPGAAFPNGRRPTDDVMDRLLTLINNRVALGDNVNRNDVGFRSAFPFLAPPHQPLPRGAVDPTQN